MYTVYSTRLLMIDRKHVRNMSSSIPKINLIISASLWFYYKNISRCAVLWMSKSLKPLKIHFQNNDLIKKSQVLNRVIHMKQTPVLRASLVIEVDVLQQTWSSHSLPEEGNKSILQKVVGFLAWDDGQCPKRQLHSFPLHLAIRKISVIVWIDEVYLSVCNCH